LIDRYFKLTEHGTTIRQEMLGGLTTFVTMAYVIIVNPRILSDAGCRWKALYLPHASRHRGNVVNGPLRQLPDRAGARNVVETPICVHRLSQHALCPGGLRWRWSSFRHRLPAIDRVAVREQIVNGMPNWSEARHSDRNRVFIAFIGLRNAKLVVANPATFVGLGSFSDKEVQTACFGIALTIILMARKVNGGILKGSWHTLVGILRGITPLPTSIVALPHPPRRSCNWIFARPSISAFWKSSSHSSLSTSSITSALWLGCASKADLSKRQDSSRGAGAHC